MLLFLVIVFWSWQQKFTVNALNKAIFEKVILFEALCLLYLFLYDVRMLPLSQCFLFAPVLAQLAQKLLRLFIFVHIPIPVPVLLLSVLAALFVIL